MKLGLWGVLFCVCVCVCVFRATPTAYGGSQARGLIGAATASLHHQQHQVQAASVTYTTVHGNTGPLTPEQGQGLNLQPHGS